LARCSSNPGFDTGRPLAFSVFLPTLSYPEDSDLIRFDHDFTERIRALPGVVGVASTSIVPLTGGGKTIRFVIEGQPTPAGQENKAISATSPPVTFR
jgi:hypothetical protein